LEELYCNSEKSDESVAVWFWILYGGYVMLKGGEKLGYDACGYVYLLDSFDALVITSGVSARYINQRRY